MSEDIQILKVTTLRAAWRDKYGDHEIVRRPGESEDEFQQRVRDELARGERGE